MKKYLFFIFILLTKISIAQNQNKNWYFGNGTDGMVFNAQNVPVKVNNKYPGVGFEGIAVASDPCSGGLLFYTDGITVVDKNHNLMSNGTGLLANYSGSQCVQICKVPGICNQYYIISNSSWDNTPGSFYYSIVDFSSDPLGQVIIKNQLINGPNYHQAMRIIPKTNSNNYWLIGHLYNTATYHVVEITPSGFIGPVIYTFNNSGRSWTMEYNEKTHKLVNMGQDNINVSLFDFNPSTGVLSNEQQLYTGTLDAYIGNFSPDGSKIYAGLGSNVLDLWQYDFSNNLWTNMNTCCWAHDVKTGPDGITYFLHSFSDPNPLSQMINANLSAVGNACGYSVLTTPGNFNGQVRRFPEFLQIPDPPIANIDTIAIASGSSVILYPLANDFDPQGDIFSLTSIISGPLLGNAVINGNQINYSANSGICNYTDTIIYLITDNTCMCDTAKILIHINGVFPISQFNLLSDSCSGFVTFLNLSLNASNYNWDFGDSSVVQTGTNPTHNYTEPGNYNITLIASNFCSSDTFTYSLTLNLISLTVASYTYSNPTCTYLFNFINQSQNGISYLWDFGDGILDTISNPSHTYSTVGNYNVTLIAFPSSGCYSDTIIHLIAIKEIPITIASYNVTRKNCSHVVDFHNLSLNTDSCFWDFGDGTSSTLYDVSHTYSDTGIYYVMFIAFGQCMNDTSFIIVPDTFSAGKALFDFSEQLCESEIQFINQSQNSFSYYWDFGDGTNDVTSNPVHSYQSNGIYTIKLSVNIGSLCSDSITKTIESHTGLVSTLFIPNSFTPNGDGINDKFEIFGKTDCDLFTLYIYNRWGNLLYKTEDILNFWDARVNNNFVEEGVYCYMIIGKNYLKTGSLSVIR